MGGEHTVRLLPRSKDSYTHLHRVSRHPPLPDVARGLPSAPKLPQPKHLDSYYAHRDAIARIPRPVSASLKPALERPATAPHLNHPRDVNVRPTRMAPVLDNAPAAWLRADVLRTEQELASKAVHVALGEQPASGKAVFLELLSQVLRRITAGDHPVPPRSENRGFIEIL